MPASPLILEELLDHSLQLCHIRGLLHQNRRVDDGRGHVGPLRECACHGMVPQHATIRKEGHRRAHDRVSVLMAHTFRAGGAVEGHPPRDPPLPILCKTAPHESLNPLHSVQPYATQLEGGPSYLLWTSSGMMCTRRGEIRRERLPPQCRRHTVLDETQAPRQEAPWLHGAPVKHRIRTQTDRRPT